VPTAADFSKQYKYSIEQDGSRYRIVSNFNPDDNRRRRRFKTSLVVKVPKRASLVIDNRNGNVDVSGLTGDQKINNSFGNVTLIGIAGATALALGPGAALLIARRRCAPHLYGGPGSSRVRCRW